MNLSNQKPQGINIMAKMTKQQLIEALNSVSHGQTLEQLEKLTNKELGTLLQSSPKLEDFKMTAPLPVLTKEDAEDQAFVDSLKPAVNLEKQFSVTEITPESIEHDKNKGLVLPVGYSVMKEGEDAYYIVLPNGKDSEKTHTSYSQAVCEAIEDSLINPTKVVTRKRGQSDSVDKKVSAKDKAYDLFKNNAELKSGPLLDLVCLELSMDRKVASSYLCYYRKEYNIVATRGLTKEDKLKAFINDHFATDLSEGQMKAILSTINED